jgi:hypothetical protein
MSEALVGYMSLSEEEVVRRHAAACAEKGGVQPKESNSVFGHCIRASWNLMREWRRTKDRRAGLTGDELAKAFNEELAPEVRRLLGTDGKKARQAYAILKKATAFAAATYDPTKADTRRRRGILKDEVKGMDLYERQAAGGEFVAQDRRDNTVEDIRVAVRALQVAGEEVTQAEIARRTGKARRTVIRRWAEACGGLVPGVTDGVKKKSLHPTGPSDQSSQSRPAHAPRRKLTVRPKSQFIRPSFLNREPSGAASGTALPPPAVSSPSQTAEPQSSQTEEASTGHPSSSSRVPAFMRAEYDRQKAEAARRAAAPLDGTRSR